LVSDFYYAHFVDRRWQPEVKPRALLSNEFTEAKNGTNFIGVDAEGKRVLSDERSNGGASQKQQRSGYAAAIHDLFHAVLTAFQNVFEIRRFFAAAAATAALTPRATATAAAPAAATLAPRAIAAPIAATLPAAATAAALIVPRHSFKNLRVDRSE